MEQRERASTTERFPSPDDYINQMEGSGYFDHANAYRQVVEVADVINRAGGRALLVGGSVRDAVLGNAPKDYDIEVYGLPVEQVKELVMAFGHTREVGRSFGILKMFIEGGLQIDISLPRKDSKVEPGAEGGFAYKADHTMSIKDAARRRDFTINAPAADPLTGEIFDYFGGLKDMQDRVLRITDPERFADEPLRVMRAMQFVGRYGMEIDPEALRIMQEIAPRMRESERSRVGEEWRKLLLRSEKPSLGLSAGMALGIFKELHPDFPRLMETPQEPEWHPEGNVWVHTMMTVDEAAKIIRREQLDSQKALPIMLAVLCHDLGKIETTYIDENGRIVSPKHEPYGKEPTRKFLSSLGMSSAVISKVVNLVAEHLVPTVLYLNENMRGSMVSAGAIRKLASRLDPATIQELVMVCEADHYGRGEFPPDIREQLCLPPNVYDPGPWMLERARQVQVEDSRPPDLTRGRDWLNFGFEPGRDIGALIMLANDLRDEMSFSREMVFQTIDGVLESAEAIERLRGIRDYHRMKQPTV